MFIARDRFLNSVSYELSKMRAFCSIRKIENEENLWPINISCLTALFPTGSEAGSAKLAR